MIEHHNGMIEHHNRIASTSTYLKEHCQGLPNYYAVTTSYQTAGRGQRGNGWESEAGSNLLMSLLYIPEAEILPSRQFMISMAVSLATAETVDTLLTDVNAPEVSVKWPNDIYIGDCKVAGILIENTLDSRPAIARSIIGIGLNLNQLKFESPAPNPVSVITFTHRLIDVDTVAVMLRDNLISHLSNLNACDRVPLTALYKSRLWRREGFYPYLTLTPSLLPAPTAVKEEEEALPPDTLFEAEIVDVDPDGPITMRLRSGQTVTFNFKEMTPVLPAM